MKKVGKYSISLKVFLKNSAGEILILKTPDSSSFHGKYDLPGGRIDEDEFYTDMLEILKREVIEEVGNIRFSINDIPVVVARHRAEKSIGYEDIFYSFWEAEYIDGDVCVSDEHTIFEWVKLSEIDLEDYFESGMLDAAKMYLSRG